MNETMQAFARQTLKDGLAKLNPKNHRMFNQMYNPENLDADVNDTVDDIDASKLDWAMQQVERTIQTNLTRENM
jgi:hypothetical protein